MTRPQSTTRPVALSIRQPWAWAILHAGKDVENRTWRTTRRGAVLIHASLQVERAAFDIIERITGHRPPSDLPTGGIVGGVTVTDCVSDLASPWFAGPHGLRLTGAVPLPFCPCKGRLGFFAVDDRTRNFLQCVPDLWPPKDEAEA